MGLLLLTKTKKVIKLETIDKNFKAGAQKGSTNYNQKVILVDTPIGKFPPQAGKIIEALLAAKDYTLTVGELVGSTVVKTALEKVGWKQSTPMDIWSFIKLDY